MANSAEFSRPEEQIDVTSGHRTDRGAFSSSVSEGLIPSREPEAVPQDVQPGRRAARPIEDITGVSAVQAHPVSPGLQGRDRLASLPKPEVVAHTEVETLVSVPLESLPASYFNDLPTTPEIVRDGIVAYQEFEERFGGTPHFADGQMRGYKRLLLGIDPERYSRTISFHTIEDEDLQSEVREFLEGKGIAFIPIADDPTKISLINVRAAQRVIQNAPELTMGDNDQKVPTFPQELKTAELPEIEDWLHNHTEEWSILGMGVARETRAGLLSGFPHESAELFSLLVSPAVQGTEKERELEALERKGDDFIAFSDDDIAWRQKLTALENVTLETSESAVKHGALDTLLEPGLLAAIYQARKATKDRLDSHGGRDWWPVQNSPIEAYEMDFADVLKGKKIADFLEGKKGAVVIDLMASTGTIADLFSQLPPDPDRHGIALMSKDNRDQKEKERDAQLGIVQLEGDITRPLQLAQRFRAELGDKKADIIMVDAGMGKKHIPDHPQYRRMIMQVLWDFVSENNGVLLLDLPPNTEVIEWREIVQKHGIEVRAPRYGHSLLLVKTPDSPKKLPSISDNSSVDF